MLNMLRCTEAAQNVFCAVVTFFKQIHLFYVDCWRKDAFAGVLGADILDTC